MKILVTGAAGFIGFSVAKALLERGDEVVGVDNLNDYYDPNFKQSRINELEKIGKEKFSFHKIDITDKDQIMDLCKKNNFDKICHLAAQGGVRYSITHPHIYEESNIQGTLTVFEAARHNNVPQVVFASSSSVYGNSTKEKFTETDDVSKPVSFYAATKVANELMAYTYNHLYKIKMTGLRFFTVYGPWGRPDMAAFKFTKNIIEGNPIDVYNNGEMARDFTFIADIVQGIVAAIDKPFDYEIINLGNDHPIPLMQFIETIEKACGKKAQKNMMEMQQGDVYKTAANIEKAKKLLNYQPTTTLEEGMNQFVTWYKQFYTN